MPELPEVRAHAERLTGYRAEEIEQARAAVAESRFSEKNAENIRDRLASVIEQRGASQISS